MKIKAMVATLNEDVQCFTFSESALKDIADTAVGKPIMINFDSNRTIGIITKSEFRDGKVFIKGKVDGILMDIENEFCVPGVMSDPLGENNVMQNCKSYSFAVTKNPSDKTLTNIEEDV